jgi:L,D-transpeptidase ErfK/SrfK
MMQKILKKSSLSSGLRLIALCLFILFLHGCAALQNVHEQAWLPPGFPAEDLEQNNFPVAKGDDVIGQLAVMKIAAGDTLPDIARHFSLGINALRAANPGVDTWVPKAGQRIMLPLSFTLPDAPREGIVVNLATMRLFQFKGNGNTLAVSTYPVGVGTNERPTPTGQMHVARKATRPTWHVPASIAEDHRKKGDPLPAAVPPGPDNPLGEFALYLSKPSYLIHGTNKPASIGMNATNGCLRLFPEDVQTLYNDTPVKTPVVIVSQPYLIGQRGGVLYLEAHKPLDDSGSVELEKAYARLRAIEKRTARALDWDRIEKILTEARGIPVPIFELNPGGQSGTPNPLEIAHPGALFGRPEIPELNLAAWYILAADLRDETEARRLAAIINHQGPPIPARVLSKKDVHRVIAGPFQDGREATMTARRLKIDLGLDGVVIAPDNQRSSKLQ